MLHLQELFSHGHPHDMELLGHSEEAASAGRW